MKALAWSDYLRSHALRFYACGAFAAEAGARLILSRRDSLPSPFRARDVHQKGWAGLADRDTVEAALEILARTRHVQVQEIPSGLLGGRPTQNYLWNPKIEPVKP